MKILINTIYMQIKLMFDKKEFKFVFAINLGYILLTYLYYTFKFWGDDISTIASPNAVFALQDTSVYYDIYVNIIPFLVVFPYAMSFINDNKNLILPMLQVRSGIKNYYISKGIACFVGGFIAFFVPLIINILLNNVTFPNSGITFIGDLFDINYNARIVGSNIIINTKWAGIWFPEFYIEHPEGYNILFSIIFSMAMGFFSVFVYSLSFAFKKKIMLLLPLYIIIVTLNTIDMFLSGSIPYMCYKVFSYLSVNTNCGKNPIYIYIFFLIIIITSLFLIRRQIKKDQLE